MCDEEPAAAKDSLKLAAIDVSVIEDATVEPSARGIDHAG